MISWEFKNRVISTRSGGSTRLRSFVAFATLIFSLAIVENAFAQTPYQLGDIEFSGDGCGAPGQTSVVFNTEASTASILFSELFLQVESGPFATRVRSKRLRCNVRVPVFPRLSGSMSARYLTPVEKKFTSIWNSFLRRARTCRTPFHCSHLIRSILRGRQWLRIAKH